MKQNRKENLVACTSIGLVIFAALLLSFPMVLADDVIDTVVLTLQSSCSMTSTLDTAHTATFSGEHYEPDIGQTTIKTVCNDPDGFSIYAVGFTNDTEGKTFLSSSVGSEYNVVSGTATSGDTSNWAMKLTSVSGTYAPTIDNGFNSYHIVPKNYIRVAYRDNQTDQSLGSSFRTTYAAYMTALQPAGTYTGKVKYTLIHPKNEDAPRVDPMTIENLTYMQEFATLSSAEKTSVLSSMTTDAQYTLLDSRDNKEYYIAKLQDGKVWMTQNLDLKLGTNTLTHNSRVLYHDDTDLGWGSTIDTSASWDPGTTYHYTASANGSFTSLGSNTTRAASLDVGDYYYIYSANLPYTTVNYLTATKNANGEVVNNNNVYFATTPSGTNGRHGHVGDYYTWPAAIASTSAYDTSTYSNVANNPQTSICPAGWRLPTATSASPNYSNATTKNEFARLAYLYASYSGTTSISSRNMEASPLYFVRGGYTNGTSLSYPGNYGQYWTSTVYTSGTTRGAYILRFYSNTLQPNQNNSYRYRANTVRCVLR